MQWNWCNWLSSQRVHTVGALKILTFTTIQYLPYLWYLQIFPILRMGNTANVTVDLCIVSSKCQEFQSTHCIDAPKSHQCRCILAEVSSMYSSRSHSAPTKSWNNFHGEQYVGTIALSRCPHVNVWICKRITISYLWLRTVMLLIILVMDDRQVAVFSCLSWRYRIWMGIFCKFVHCS